MMLMLKTLRHSHGLTSLWVTWLLGVNIIWWEHINFCYHVPLKWLLIPPTCGLMLHYHVVRIIRGCLPEYSKITYNNYLLCVVYMIVQNYQSTFYQTSGETEVEDDEEKLLPLAINVHPSSVNTHRARNSYPNSATNATAIFPRSTPLSPVSYQTSPWLRTLPSQSVRSASGAPPPKPVGSSTPATGAAATAHTAKNTSHPWTFALSVHVIVVDIISVVVDVVFIDVYAHVCMCVIILWSVANDQCCE